MLHDSVQMVEQMAILALPLDRRPSEEEVADIVTKLAGPFEVSPSDQALIIERIHTKVAITMNVGNALVEHEFRPWLKSRKAEIDPFFWERYRKLLGKMGWAPQVVNTLDTVSDEVLDLCGDPKTPGRLKRRGLVIGDVQSGKTAMYTALSCKAADAEFRLIVLLTGTIESLRRQTQIRLDEGFVGLNSSDKLQANGSKYVGVGLIDKRRTAGVLTSRTRDFTAGNAVAFQLNALNEPFLMVVKKNVNVLKNLNRWLGDYNAIEGKITTPLLLIDDEADSASINTNKELSDPTAINMEIRRTLDLFERSSYVGFTATPFANVFIDPDDEHKMVGEGLFPADYIYVLSPASNYVGPVAIFDKDDPFGDPLLREIVDADEYIPPSHKSNYVVEVLPPSLVEALYVFLLANAVRDIRGQVNAHRSMLVNVSRFTNVQEGVRSLMDDLLKDVQRDIRTFSKLGETKARNNSAHIANMEKLYANHYPDVDVPWGDVLMALHEAVQPITVQAVNQRSGAAALNYQEHAEHGLRVVAVGGNSLSRGLTLEGLMTSYFFRNSKMYDTLLQMGRWFGYRDGYRDLCRLWITRQAADWYQHITAASEELRGEVKVMRAAGMTPREFGLKVRAHPDSLLVTAQNKMQAAKTIERYVALSKMGLETSQLIADRGSNDLNLRAVGAFIETLDAVKLRSAEARKAKFFWRGVPHETVATFLAQFRSHPLNFGIQLDRISEFLHREATHLMPPWDVAVAEGTVGELYEIGGIRVRPSSRYVTIEPTTKSWYISGTKQRVGSGGSEVEGLTDDQVARADALAREDNLKSTPDRLYRAVRTYPLLFLYVISGHDKDERPMPAGQHEPLCALSLSFSEFDDSGIAQKVKYRVNVVELKQLELQLAGEIDDDIAGNE